MGAFSLGATTRTLKLAEARTSPVKFSGGCWAGDNENQPKIPDTKAHKAPETQPQVSGIFEPRIRPRFVSVVFVIQHLEHHEENRVENAQGQEAHRRSKCCGQTSCRTERSRA